MTSRTASLTLSDTGRALLAARAHEAKQKDELCGAFCAAVVIAALISTRVEQETIAQEAATRLSGVIDPDNLPPGETPRRDYSIDLPTAATQAEVGTSASGVARAIATVSGGVLAAVPLTGNWHQGPATSLLLDLTSEPDTAVIVNVATRHLWHSRVDPVTVHDYLAGAHVDVPGSEWNVGHFILLVGSLQGTDRRLALCADTYPALGNFGLHVQPTDGLAAALERADDPQSTGGALIVVPTANADSVARRAQEAGLRVELWDNGSPDAAHASGDQSTPMPMRGDAD